MKIKAKLTVGIISCIAFAFLLCVLTAFIVSTSIQYSAKDKIYSISDIDKIGPEYEAIVVLGAGVKDDGTPSAMLYDRIYCAYELYAAGICNKIIMSGDHTGNYDEPGTMKKVAIELGVPEENILIDEKGFSTGETISRVFDIFNIQKAIFVTQEYHLGRTLYISRTYNIEAIGVSADYRSYSGQIFREIREVIARTKDFMISSAK